MLRCDRLHTWVHLPRIDMAEVALISYMQWRYVQIAARFLYYLLRRDVAPSPEVAKFFLNQTTSPQPAILTTVQK